MKITTAGSLGNVGRPLVKMLTEAGHEVTVITSNPDRQDAIEALGASAAVGSVSDAEFLAQAFAGADAVFAMTPPAMGGTNIIENIAKQGILSAGLPEELAGLLTEMGQSIRDGILTKHFFASGTDVTGSIKLEQFSEAFKNSYFKN